MNKIKHASAAGTFYPNNKENFLKLISSYKVPKSTYNSRAIIVPHAGYKYSGELAFKGYSYLDKNIKNIFIFAPAHYERIYGCILSDYEEWETPLGNIKTNTLFAKELLNYCESQINNTVFEKEHSIEVQLPFIKYLFPQAKIIPVLYGCENFTNISETISHFYKDKNNGFIISSDLSHFYPEREAIKIDNYTAKQIEEISTQNFDIEQACGAVGICGIIDFAKKKNYSLIRVGLTNSAKTTGDSSRVVGYGSWFLYEGETDKYIKEYFSEFIINTCKDSIRSGLQLGDFTPLEYPCVFDEQGASFVTLKINNNLRGCIGSIIAHRPLIRDITHNAHAAAFSDPRFKKLTLDEFDKIQITVSLLSKPKHIEFCTEDELLEKIEPYTDGLIIRDGNFQGVFLPDVWEQLPDKKEFLKQLKIKAGLPPNYLSNNLEAFKFQSIKIE